MEVYVPPEAPCHKEGIEGRVGVNKKVRVAVLDIAGRLIFCSYRILV
jgi:hypothetical protein